MTLALRIAKRELRAGLYGFKILIACLALGVAAIAGVGSIRSAIDAALTQQGAVLLGGDGEAEFTYRFATTEERAWFEANATAVSEVVDFRSMARVEYDETFETALTQIKGIDSAYPLLGKVVLENDLPLDQALADRGIVMERVLSDRLGLKTGDSVWLGTGEFRLGGVLISYPDGAGDGFGLGPRTLVYTEDLRDTGLLAEGTLFTTKYRLTFDGPVDYDSLETSISIAFPNSGLRWRDARNGAPGIAEFVERLGSFLILVGLSGLAVGGIGVSAAVRTYMQRKTTVIATLRSIGAANRTIFQIYFLQIMAISIFGILLGICLGVGIPILIAPLLEASLPFPISVGVYARPIFEAALYGALTAIIFTLWPLAMTENIKASTLFRDGGLTGFTVPSAKYLVAILVVFVALLASASWFIGSVKLTIWAAIGILGALFILALSALVTRFLSRKFAPLSKGRPKLRWSLSAISGQSEGAVSVVLSLGLGLSVLASIGQIDGNLRAAIEQDLPEVAPSFFFVDIQKSQMSEFSTILDEDDAVSRVDAAPMLRGIISQINGQPARDVVGDHWVIEGDRGLTYSATPPPNTTITEGDWWPADYTGPAQVSFAAEEAEEMGLSLGDTLTLNIMGRDITATITSFRVVDFSTAGIGFVMSINPSALAGAPHSFIATVYADPDEEARILRQLSKTFPNITAIRIKDAIDRVSTLLGSIASATSYGAAASLLTGFLVLIGSAASNEHTRAYEAAVLKTLGATRRQILMSFALRSAVLGASAGLVALGAGVLGGWAVLTFVMNLDFTIMWPVALAIVFGGIFTNLAAGLGFALRALRAKPAKMLRSRE